MSQPTASQKAADRMNADLDAMVDNAARYADTAADDDSADGWRELRNALRVARSATLKVMSERDKRIAAKA